MIVPSSRSKKWRKAGPVTKVTSGRPEGSIDVATTRPWRPIRRTTTAEVHVQSHTARSVSIFSRNHRLSTVRSCGRRIFPWKEREIKNCIFRQPATLQWRAPASCIFRLFRCFWRNKGQRCQPEQVKIFQKSCELKEKSANTWHWWGAFWLVGTVKVWIS